MQSLITGSVLGLGGDALQWIAVIATAFQSLYLMDRTEIEIVYLSIFDGSRAMMLIIFALLSIRDDDSFNWGS